MQAIFILVTAAGWRVGVCLLSSDAARFEPFSKAGIRDALGVGREEGTKKRKCFVGLTLVWSPFSLKSFTGNFGMLRCGIEDCRLFADGDMQYGRRADG